MNYWVCHIRGADFTDLKKLGFITLYPYCDDYAFLPVTDGNKKLLYNETHLKVLFLRCGGEIAIVTEEELQNFGNFTLSQIQVKAKIEVLEGPYSQMKGYIESISGNTYHCKIESYSDRFYDVDLERTQFVLDEEHHGTYSS